MKRIDRFARIKAIMLAALVAGMPAAYAGSLLIENATLIDGTGRPPVAGVWVLVQEDRIRQLSRRAIEAPADSRRIDGTGKFLLPGLMDMHVHLKGGVEVTPEGLLNPELNRARGIRALHSYLYTGVTSIYDAGNFPDYILGLRDDERSGELVGPRIFATGGIVTYPGSHGGSDFATRVDSWPEAKPMLDAHIAREPDIVKLTFEERGWGSRPMIPKLPVDLMQRIIEYYNDRGIPSTVHTSSELRARQAVFAGVDSLAHPVIQGPITDEFAKLMGAKKIPMVTTLTIGDNYSRLAEHPEYLDTPMYRATLTSDEIELLKGEKREEYRQRKWTWWMKIMTGIAQQNLYQVYQAGGVLVAGTDQSSGPALHRELELLAEAGIPPLEIIRMATLNGAAFLGRERELGSVEEGKIADMILLKADPTLDIRNTGQVAHVIKAGEVIDLSKLQLPVND